jgi:hypothetical protein
MTPKIKREVLVWTRGAFLGVIGYAAAILLAAGRWGWLWGWKCPERSQIFTAEHAECAERAERADKTRRPLRPLR